jgi:putative intracellular protease/amidase/YHS domain-containing protein
MKPKTFSRRDLLRVSGTAALAAAIPFQSETPHKVASKLTVPANPARPLQPPTAGSIPVAFLISDGAVVIDFAGPWEVFGNVMIGNRMDIFNCYTVAESATPVTASGGMQIVPNFTLATAPAPKVVVLPAQGDPTKAMLEWVRNSAKTADLTVSVCTGAFLLAETGLLTGKSATTHHGALMSFQIAYPDIHVKRGARFVEDGNLASSGGLSSGIDLALRVVERYYGRATATETAFSLEYQGRGWLDPNSNVEYTKLRVSDDPHRFCAICDMEINPADAPSSAYQGKTYRFCSPGHKQQFDAHPEMIVAILQEG